jgi:hypothetical protein
MAIGAAYRANLSHLALMIGVAGMRNRIVTDIHIRYRVNRGYLPLMARKIVHQLVDDVDGQVLEPGSGETVLFSLDGIAYEIDLSEANASSLRDALAPYVRAGRSVSRGARGSSGPSAGGGGNGGRRRRSGQQDYGPIREWAKSNGYQVSERGRVPASVLEAYEAAH